MVVVSRARLAAFAAACGVASVAISALAQSAEQDARLAFQAGMEAEGAGDRAAACEHFRKSLSLVRELGPLRKVARCDAEQSRVVEAKAALEELLSRLPDDDPERPALTAELEAVTQKVGSITITRRGPTTGLRVRVDGKPTDAFDEPRPINPGRHRVEVEAAGEPPDVFDVTVPTGSSLTVEVPRAARATGEPQPPRATGLWIGGWITTAVGGAALVGAAVTGGLVLAKESEYDDCTTGCKDLQSEGNSLLVANGVLWAVGAAAAATGVTLLVIDVTTASNEPPSVAWSIRAAGPSLSLAASF